MNIKKSLLLLLTVVVVFSCKQDELLDQNTGSADLSADLSVYDNSNLGLYKGTFTTNDASERGTLEVKMLNNAPSRATLTLSSGPIIALQSTQTVTSGQNVANLNFVSTADSPSPVRFDFSVTADGTGAVITSTTFGSLDGHMLIAKETSRAPVVPIAGKYLCTSCGTHPNLGGPDGQTFNLLFIGDPSGAGPGSLDTDFTLNGTTFTDVGSGNNAQGACVTNGTFMDCPIVGFTPIGGQNMDWTGTHSYDTVGNCSQADGTWTYVSPVYGSLAGTFSSDIQCLPPANDLCGAAEALVCGTTANLNMNGSTNTGNPTVTCGTGSGATPGSGSGVWYSYTDSGAPEQIVIDLSGSTFDTKIHVYTGACGALTCVASDDDSGTGTDSFVIFDTTGDGTTVYTILVSRFGTGLGGHLVVNTTCGPIPTCSDGVQNGDETGIDCGGTVCMPCPVPECTSTTNTFAGSTGAIPDSPAPPTDFTATSTAPGTIGVDADIDNVTIDITHTWAGDLDIFLVSPAGTVLELSTDNGGSGDNYTGTIFRDGGPTIVGVPVPFTGVFNPEVGTFGAAFAGESVTGVWILRISDDGGGDTGTVDAWSIGICDSTIPDPLMPTIVTETRNNEDQKDDKVAYYEKMRLSEMNK